ncbi:MAG TPA: nuclear transport factor 2 family protein [Actinomycetota bacterium]|nr:nuclear transport factor 2 family protein [Actinomycetota bacterium]
MAHADAAGLQAVLIGSDDPEIVALEADLRAAQLAGDVDAMDRLISEQLLFAGLDGSLGTKDGDLDAYRSGVVRVREHEPAELRIRRIGPDAAIVSLLTRLAVEVEGSITGGMFRYTRIWAREDGGWRVAGGHVSAAGADAASTG